MVCPLCRYENLLNEYVLRVLLEYVMTLLAYYSTLQLDNNIIKEKVVDTLSLLQTINDLYHQLQLQEEKLRLLEVFSNLGASLPRLPLAVL